MIAMNIKQDSVEMRLQSYLMNCIILHESCNKPRQLFSENSEVENQSALRKFNNVCDIFGKIVIVFESTCKTLADSND